MQYFVKSLFFPEDVDDINNRLLTETGSAYTYDKNGNLLTKNGNGEQWQLTYNALNQVTRANITPPQGASVSAYAYDHDGIRISKTINGTEVVQYVVDKNRPYAQVLEETHTRGGTHPSPSQEGRAVKFSWKEPHPGPSPKEKGDSLPFGEGWGGVLYTGNSART